MSVCLHDGTNIVLIFILPTDHRVGGLRPHGSQVFHGRGPDTSRRTGAVQHGDRMVQTLPHVLPRRPDLGPSDEKSVPVISGEFNGTFLLSFLAAVKLLS